MVQSESKYERKVGNQIISHCLTCLNGADESNKKPSCVVQRQVEVDDIISLHSV